MIYFDNAATSFPKSAAVVKAVSGALKSCGNPGRSGHAPSMNASGVMYSCREKAARLFGAEPERVILAPSCTYALNMALKGFITGGKVLISNVEHNAAYRPLCAMRDEGRIELVFFDAFAPDVTERFSSAVRGASAAVIAHGSNVCGRLLPVAELVAAAHENGAFTVIDAAQTAGYIPVSLIESGADVICCAGHKGPGGPMGTGLMLINPGVDKLPRTLIEGGAGVYSLDEGMPEFFPERFEAGTPDVAAIAGLSAALDEFSLYEDHTAFDLLCAELSQMHRVILYGLGERGMRLPVALFNVEGIACDDVMRRLARRGICVRSGFHCAALAHRALGTLSGGVRVSLGKRNTVREVRTFCDELNKLAKALV